MAYVAQAPAQPLKQLFITNYVTMTCKSTGTVAAPVASNIITYHLWSFKKTIPSLSMKPTGSFKPLVSKKVHKKCPASSLSTGQRRRG